MAKPYLFLDVDGVLNKITYFKESHYEVDWSDFEMHSLNPFDAGIYYNLHLSKQMAAELASLPVDIVWLTTWAEEAPRLVAPILGLPEYPVAGFGTDMSEGRTSKLGCLYWWLDTHGERPFIWIDDDAISSYLDAGFKQEGRTALLIRPNQYVGITRDDIDSIRTFCKDLGYE